jgi:protein SERAC1
MPKFLNRIFKRKKAEAEGYTGEASTTSVSDGVGPLEIPNDCEGNASGADLVFIHGLRGSRLKTWSSGDVFWPQDLLKDDVKNSRVITWGYDASVANVFAYASKESIFGHANTLLSDLARFRRGIVCPSSLPY